MKRIISQAVVTTILALSLAIHCFAGDVETPGKGAPPPPPTQSSALQARVVALLILEIISVTRP
jgi:hypothetical protein